MTTLRPPVGSRDDHRLGPRDVRLEIAAFGDYECPYSRRLDRLVRGLTKTRAADVAYVFRHFPLDKIHPRALIAALAAEAAAAQGRFWDMHALLYDNQRNLAREDLTAFARSLDLDVERFSRDIDERAHLDRVRADARSGVGSGVQATPTAFLNGRRWEWQTLDDLAGDIELVLRGDDRGPLQPQDR